MSNTSVKEVFLSTCALAFAKNTYVDTDFWLIIPQITDKWLLSETE
jgi:hypothetical protein